MPYKGNSYIIPDTFVFHIPPTKRFRLIFSIWGSINSDSVSDYDTIEEMKEEMSLIKEFYKGTPRPEKIYKKKEWRYAKREYTISYDNGGSFWGYVALDYENKKIIEIYNDGCRVYKINVERHYPYYKDTKNKVTEKIIKIPYVINTKTDRLRVLDLFFRTTDDVPEGYAWSNGEYEGWLQFKWGDGKNAIGYVEPKKFDSPGRINENTVYDDSELFAEYNETEHELIQTTFEDQLSAETIKRLRDRW